MRVRRLLRAAVSFIPWFWLTGGAVARDLSFEERVKAQEAIRRVYYSHQIRAIKPFEEAVPRRILEKKVRIPLKQSDTLQELWVNSLSVEALESEVKRIARDTWRQGAGS